MQPASLGVQQASLGLLAAIAAVPSPASTEPRGEHGIHPELVAQGFISDFQPHPHQHDGAMRIGDDRFDQSVTAIRR